jgi:peptidoglycan/xylan/chitin deacetylase (PgdA/CDA1 family)
MCQACEGAAQLRQACDGAAQLRPACDGGARLRHDGAAHHRLSRRSFGRGLLAAAIAPGCLGGSAEAIVDPRMRLMLPAGAPRTVALTLDACGGAADMRIIETLLDLSIPATIFLTELWLRGNAPAVALLRSRGDQFSLQNHGERHLPPVLGNRRVYGLPVAGTPEAIRHEVEAGADAVAATGAQRPHWYRGAAALYSEAALPEIESLGFRVAAYSLNADQGASLPAATVAARIAQVTSGDVIIGHINQPHRPSGAGIAEGISTLHQVGVRFVTLDAVPVSGLSCEGVRSSQFPLA